MIFGMLTSGLSVVAMGEKHAAITDEITLDLAKRFGDFDVGLVGVARFGLEGVPTMSGLYELFAAGPELGYSFRLGDLALRAAGAWLVGRAYHPGEIVTTPHEAAGELQLGERRHDRYPFRARDAAWTLGLYVRGTAGLGSFSKVGEPMDASLGVGFILRGG